MTSADRSSDQAIHVLQSHLRSHDCNSMLYQMHENRNNARATIHVHTTRHSTEIEHTKLCFILSSIISNNMISEPKVLSSQRFNNLVKNDRHQSLQEQSCENNHSWKRQSSSSQHQHPFESMICLPSSFSTNVKKRNRYHFNRTRYRSSHALKTRKGNETLSLRQVSQIQCCVASKFRHCSQLSLAKHTHPVVNRIKDRD